MRETAFGSEFSKSEPELKKHSLYFKKKKKRAIIKAIEYVWFMKEKENF